MVRALLAAAGNKRSAATTSPRGESAGTGAGEAVTVAETVAELLALTGSWTVDETETELLRVPAVVGSTTICTVVDPPFARVPRAQPTVPADQLQPAEADSSLVRLAPSPPMSNLGSWNP